MGEEKNNWHFTGDRKCWKLGKELEEKQKIVMESEVWRKRNIKTQKFKIMT